MTIFAHDIEIPALGEDDLAAWQGIPAAVVSDSLGRAQAMAAAISPLSPTMRIVGRARTVSCMVADNSALHAAIGRCAPGDILVCDGQGFEDVALFGGLLARSAVDRGIAGLVIDGAVRDSAEIAEMGFACFARAIVPRGPHKGFGGTLDGTISCGAVPVSPGDLIIGDADGVTVVPRDRITGTLDAANAILRREEQTLARLAEGGTLAAIYGVPDVTMVKPD